METDPFAAQVRVSQGHEPTIAALEAHDTLFSFGENLGAADCTVPIERFRWHPTRQPVVLDLWEQPAASPGAAYRTITTWHNTGKHLDHLGETFYWTKDREFLKFLDLPRRQPVPFELAVCTDADTEQLLDDHGWKHTNALEVSNNVESYRRYIQRSRCEFTVARDQYVRPRTGWFSDRSACYLAAGRPVITQETGFSKFWPTGEGLFAFQSIDEILAAVDTIETDYEASCRAARAIAGEYVAAEKVLGRLMATAGL